MLISRQGISILSQRYPECTFSALSNSNGQREYIEKKAVEQNLKNLTVHTGDVNSYSFKKKFDRIISIEMFEHMKNYKSLFKKVASWLSPHGMLFTHVFCHESMPYDFVNSGN
jgi:cyclopropane-fatty-acyl-phospholipid synthase